MTFIRRVSSNELATLVKIQDLKDNMDLRRLNGKPHWKMDVYQKALSFLEGRECKLNCVKFSFVVSE